MDMTRIRIFTTLVFVALLWVAQERHGPGAEPDSGADFTRDYQSMEFASALPLRDGEGVADMEQLHAMWARKLAQEDRQAAGDAMRDLLLHGKTEAGRQAAIEGLVDLTTQDWPEDYRGDFLRALAPGALETAVEQGVPASVTLAQAIQESGWGRSGLARRHNNLFGVKSGSRKGGVTLRTREVRNGRSRFVNAPFRTFDSWAESIRHHGTLLSGDTRYARARQSWKDWRGYLEHLAPVYASDPHYAHRVGWFIERYELDRWDALVVEVARRQET